MGGGREQDAHVSGRAQYPGFRETEIGILGVGAHKTLEAPGVRSDDDGKIKSTTRVYRTSISATYAIFLNTGVLVLISADVLR